MVRRVARFETTRDRPRRFLGIREIANFMAWNHGVCFLRMRQVSYTSSLRGARNFRTTYVRKYGAMVLAAGGGEKWG